MEAIENIIGQINGLVWGPPMLVLILGVGLFLSLGLKLMPILKLGAGLRLMWGGRKATGAESDGEIPPFQALMTALAATVGTGNIAGVATAVFLGGPGALFWMWLTALVGMATKYSEAVLAVRFREVDERGSHVGGPMYYIRNGLGKKWAWLGVLFAIFAAIAGFGIGNTVQANSVADVMETTFGLPLDLRRYSDGTGRHGAHWRYSPHRSGSQCSGSSHGRVVSDSRPGRAGTERC